MTLIDLERSKSNILGDLISDICREFRYIPNGTRCIKNTLIKNIEKIKNDIQLESYNITTSQSPFDEKVRRIRVDIFALFNFIEYNKDIEYTLFIEY